MKKLYHYDEDGYFSHETEARLDPLDGKPLVPARATRTAPPAAAKNKIAKFDEDQNQWSQIPDYRGRQYWTAPGGLVEITAAGVLSARGCGRTHGRPKAHPGG